ncbi:glucose-6-phosphate isomerase [Pedomonas mirosovicensis]|uniref:glucose-6-phosphate isomerase n=1 Tax=Pedomonas mirosovicensis TaxID=2908641 RepID=UPI0035BBEF27
MKGEAWQALTAHAEEARAFSLVELFAQEADRLDRLSLNIGPLHFDFSKTHADARTLALLEKLAADAELDRWRAALFAGHVVNPTENRAATHPAERGVGAEANVAAASDAKARMKALVERVDAGAFGPIRHVLHIGIGGSALGPALLLDALARQNSRHEVEVIANIDGAALEPALKRFNPAETLIVIVSKTFTTTETMTNAEAAIDWMRAAGVADPLTRCVAVTAAPAQARKFGLGQEAILPFAETVGGRYSLWSAVGLPFALSAGWAAFEELLDGAAEMDRHFRDTPLARNAPVLAAMLDVWYATFLKAETRAVFAYDERLRLLPAYLQQLEMESNGKRVTRDGTPVDYATAAITWGGTGTDAQHAVFQLLHQGTHLVPTEFIAVVEPGHSLGGTHHQQLLANCFAQGAALMRGRTFEEALALSNGDTALAAAKQFTGNRPSTTVLLERLSPRALGMLLAFYEHRTFSAAVLLGINAFDQMGVELGKEMAKAMEKLLGGDTSAGAGFDPSTLALMQRAFRG